jgi:molybdate transport system substrate-binding protein
MRSLRRCRVQLRWTALLIVIGLIIGFLAGLEVAEHSYLKNEEKIEVFAGAAALPVYEEAAKLFESKYSIKVEIAASGSGKVLSAMTITKKGDLFIPGSPEYMLKAMQQGVVDNSTIKKLAYLVPAIIVQKGNPKNIMSLEDLAKPGIRVGIGDPQSVCVGLYAKEMLERAGLWEEVKPNIVVYAPSCSATASLIPMKSVDAIIGWHVFHYWYPNQSEIVWIKPEKIHKISCIVGAVTKFTKDREKAIMFLDFLESKEVKEIWRKYGYFATFEEAQAHAPNATTAI